MAVKRIVTITCNGPCGTVLSGNQIPEDWNYLKFEGIRTKSGEAPPRRSMAALCPACTLIAHERLKQFAFTPAGGRDDQ